MNRLFMSGPMSGIIDYNRPLFYRIEKKLRKLYPDYWIYNPANLNFDNGTPIDYCILNIPMLLTCQTIVMLPNWILSEGAKIEYCIALYCNLEIIFEEE